MTPETMARLREQLRIHEGLREFVYDDKTGKRVTILPSGGKLTVGYGFNLSDNPLPHDILEELLERRTHVAIADAKSLCPGFETFAPNRQIAITDFAYNLGLARLAKFKKMLAAANRGDWQAAAKEARSSKWATQVQSARVNTVCHQLEFG